MTSFRDKFKIQNTNFTLSRTPVRIKTDGQVYQLNLHKDGQAITLTKTDEDANLKYPYQLPDIEVKALTKNARLVLANGKHTYLEFWGTWCKPCLEIIPDMIALKKNYSDRLNIISIDYMDNDLAKVKDYILKYRMDWDHLVADRNLIEEFAHPYFPCGVLFDPDGNLIEYGISPNDVGNQLSKTLN